jgi:signal transduction histidine kinase
LTDHSRFQVFDDFRVPLCVFNAEAVLYANQACAELLGLPGGGSEIDIQELIQRFVDTKDQGMLQRSLDGLAKGEDASEVVWFHLVAPDKRPRHVCARRYRGTRGNEWLCLLSETPEEGAVQALTGSLAVAAGELMGCREEREVLERSVEVLHRAGFYCTTMLLDGDALVHGPMRQDPDALAAGEALYGRPIAEVRFPRAGLPHLERMFETRRGVFQQEFLRALEGFHTPEVVKLLQRAFPGSRAADAPLFVDGKPYGFLSVQGFTLTPACAGAVELFAQMMGSALDNVRHHKEAARRVRELHALQEELVARERLAALGEAAAVVSHEVRNPLGAILNAVSILRRDPSGTTRTNVVSMIEEEVLRLDQLVGDLLAFARPLEARVGRVDPEALVNEALEQLRAQHPELNVTVVPNLQALPAPGLRADPVLLQLALSNLLRNAVQASPPGGQVELRVEPGKDASVDLVVEDAGPGVAEHLRGRIFEPFFTTRATGSGLGLAVVQRVAHAHKGTVSVDRGNLGGAAFRLSIPRGTE